MLAANRHEEIMKLILKDKFVKVSQLSMLFNVTEETIRRDLDKLEKRGLIKKLHGGAVPIGVASIDNIKPIVERIEENINEKQIIGHLACKLIEDGDTLILDSGSTTLQIARLLDNKKVTVITNDINIAYVLSNKENVNLIVTGGNLTPKSFSLVGPECERYLKIFNVNKLFLSTRGINLKQGFTVSNSMDASIKRIMINAANKVICTADHTKFGKTALVTFASFDDVDLIITNKIDDSSYIKAFNDMGIDLITPETKDLQLFT